MAPKPKIFKKLFSGIILLVAVGGISCWTWQYQQKHGQSAKDAALATATAAIRDIEQVVLCNGEVAPVHLIQVKSQLSGQVVKVLVQAGEQVAKDQILVELDRRKLESQVNEATLSIESTRLQAEKSRQETTRKDELFQHALVSQKDQQDTQLDAAIANNEYKLRQANLETLRQDLLKMTIPAPLAGLVLSVLVDPGDVIVGTDSAAAGTILLTVANLEVLVVKSEINEIDVAKLQPGHAMELTFDSIPGVKANGVLEFVSPAAAPKGTEKEVRVFPLKVKFAATDPRIRLGISARLKIPVAHVDKVVALPMSAVFQEETAAVVYVAKASGGYDRREVQVGINDAKFIEIKQGVKDQETVALTRPPGFDGPKGKSK